MARTSGEAEEDGRLRNVRKKMRRHHEKKLVEKLEVLIYIEVLISLKY